MSEPVIPEVGKRVDFNIVSYDQWRMRAEAAEAKVAELEAAALRFVQSCAVQCPACKQYVDAALSKQEKP